MVEQTRHKWGERKKWGTFRWGGSSFCRIGTELFETYDMTITNNRTKEVDTADFGVICTANKKPQAWQDMSIISNNEKIFGGRIQTVTETRLDGNEFFYQCSCIDYTHELQKKLIKEAYTNKTVSYIILDILSKYVSNLDGTAVVVNSTIVNYVKFNYVYPQEAFEYIASLVGWDWYVDYEKTVHFFPKETYSAPISLTDNGTEFDDLQITCDRSQVVNRVFVKGGKYLSDVYAQTPIAAVAGQTEFSIAYTPREPFSVTVGGVAKTVGIENADFPGSHNFLLNAAEKVLKADTQTFTGGEAVVMSYTYEIPIAERVDDLISQALIRAIVGADKTDGIYEKVIADDTIETVAGAQQAGEAEILRNSPLIITGSFTSIYPGWKAGQTLSVNLTDRGIVASYSINRVTRQAIGAEQFAYVIEFGNAFNEYQDFLLDLFDKKKIILERDDEYINIVQQMQENVSASDSVTVTKAGKTFKYGSAKYGFAQYS